MANEVDPVVVVCRLPDGTHGAALLIAAGDGGGALRGTVAEWRALVRKIEDTCALAERPGLLPERVANAPVV
jgi:hypothetical protein